MGDHERVRYLAPLLVLAALAGCGGDVDPAETPAGRAQAFVLEDLYNGRVDRAYTALHPAYQRIVPRSRFLACAKKVPLGKLDSIEVLDVFDETTRVPGLGEQRGKAVRVRLTSTTGDTTTFVNHELKVGDGWRWVLNDSALRDYEAGRCPGE